VKSPSSVILIGTLLLVLLSSAQNLKAQEDKPTRLIRTAQAPPYTLARGSPGSRKRALKRECVLMSGCGPCRRGPAAAVSVNKNETAA